MPSLYGLSLQRVFLVGFTREKRDFCSPSSLWSSWAPHCSFSLEDKLWTSGWEKSPPSLSCSNQHCNHRTRCTMNNFTPPKKQRKRLSDSHDSTPKNKCGCETIRACLLSEHGLMRRRRMGPTSLGGFRGVQRGSMLWAGRGAGGARSGLAADAAGEFGMMGGEQKLGVFFYAFCNKTEGWGLPSRGR